MPVKQYAVRVSVLIFTFMFACVIETEYRHIREYFIGDEMNIDIHAAPCSVREASSGQYKIANPTVPAAFKDIKYLQIERQWYDPQKIDSNWSGVVAPGGYLYARGGHRLTWSASTPNRLAFESESTDGMSYRFLGKVQPFYGANDASAHVQISGTLYLISSGRIVDSMYVVFVETGC